MNEYLKPERGQNKKRPKKGRSRGKKKEVETINCNLPELAFIRSQERGRSDKTDGNVLLTTVSLADRICNV